VKSELRNPNSAILLLGPTGSGKTPLGDYLQQNGLAGRRCAHFDFGAHLREIDRTGELPAALAPTDLQTIRDALAGAALFENDQFRIPREILLAYCRDHALKVDDRLVLNGLPRHQGQAAALEKTVAVNLIIVLECSVEVILDRIRENAEGDREGRIDDSPQNIASKLTTFRARTVPLLDYFRGVQVVTVCVSLHMNAAEKAAVIETALARSGES
jgi:adenylate kinase family enzyme